MSSSTIPTTIRPGQATLERFAAKQAQMLANRDTNATTFADAHIEELTARDIENPEGLGALRGRLEASAPFASARELRETRALLEGAERGDSLEEAETAVDRLQEESARRWADRSERELLLEDLAELTGVRVKDGTMEMKADGRLTAAVELPDGRTIPVSITGSRATGAANGSSVVFRCSESNIVGDGTQAGACEAQEAVVEGFVTRAGGRMSRDATPGPPEPRSAPHRVSRGAR